MSSTGSTSNVISASTGQEDRALHSVDNAIFMPKQWSRMPRHAKDVKEIQPVNGAAYNTTLVFDIPENAELLTDLHLEIETGTADASASATAAAWVNGLGYEIWESMELVSGNEIMQTLFSEDCKLFDSLHNTIRDDDRDAVLYYQGRSLAQRQADAPAGILQNQSLVIRVPFYFTKSLRQALFLPHFERNLRVRIKIRPIESLVYADAATALANVSGFQAQLRADYMHLEQLHRSELLDLFVDNAVPYLIGDHQRHRQERFTRDAKASQVYQLQLRNLRGPIAALVFGVRALVDADQSNSTQLRAPDAYLPFTSYAVQDSNSTIVPTQTFNYDQYVERRRHWEGPVGNNIAAHTFARLPMREDEATGSANFRNYFNATLLIDVSNLAAGDYSIDVIAQLRNWVTHKGGTAVRTFQG